MVFSIINSIKIPKGAYRRGKNYFCSSRNPVLPALGTRVEALNTMRLFMCIKVVGSDPIFVKYLITYHQNHASYEKAIKILKCVSEQ